MPGSPFPSLSQRPSGRGTLVTEDGLHLFTQHWDPEGEVRAVVALVHGYGEHCGRYGHVAQAMTRAGAAVYAYDQRGYGRSDGTRAYVESFDVYNDDLERFLAYVDERSPDVPLYLFGHSMGGLVVLRHALTRSLAASGLVLSAPAIEINPNLAAFLRRIAQWLGRRFPKLKTVRSPQGAISRDADVVEQAENDPLNYHGRVLARTGAEMIRAGKHAQENLSDLSLPFFVFHGTADELTNPDWSQRLYDRAASTDKTIEFYDGLYHETFNEPEKERVLDDVHTWLSERIGG
jgi:alpha-beta hydrolase superfamily lysophospholipase